jgi:hypothetical protein
MESCECVGFQEKSRSYRWNLLNAKSRMDKKYKFMYSRNKPVKILTYNYISGFWKISYIFDQF